MAKVRSNFNRIDLQDQISAVPRGRLIDSNRRKTERRTSRVQTTLEVQTQTGWDEDGWVGQQTVRRGTLIKHIPKMDDYRRWVCVCIPVQLTR